MAVKTDFGRAVQKNTNQFIQAAEKLINLGELYTDRGYNSGGSSPIVDGDVSDLGFTATQLGSLFTMVTQLSNFLNNGTVTEADYDATVSIIRSDL